VYIDVYDSERPELFLKATPSRTVGPNEAIGIRGDSTWDVPEPELGVVLHREEVVGYTIGNDVSSRAIEGENPLYLPARCTTDAVRSARAWRQRMSSTIPTTLEMALSIERDGEVVFEDSTSTNEMATTTCENLVSYLRRHNNLPETVVLLTGTALVPPESFTLTEGDPGHDRHRQDRTARQRHYRRLTAL